MTNLKSVSRIWEKIKTAQKGPFCLFHNDKPQFNITEDRNGLFFFLEFLWKSLDTFGAANIKILWFQIFFYFFGIHVIDSFNALLGRNLRLIWLIKLSII